jgi:hypothetical protein
MLIFSRADIISFASMEFKLIGLLKSKKKRKNLANLKALVTFFERVKRFSGPKA